MQNQHKELTHSLYKRYLCILILSLSCFSIALTLINELYNLKDNQFNKHESNYRFQLGEMIHSAELIGDSYNQVLQLQFGVEIGNMGSFCGSGITVGQCGSLQNQTQANVIIQNHQGTSTSFRCLSGSCQEAGYLSDFLWLYRLRFPYISYLLISYQYNSTSSALIVPSLATQTVSTANISVQTTWSLSYISNTIVLSKTFSMPQMVTMHIVLDSAVLLSRYSIDLQCFDFSQPSFPRLQKEYHFEYETGMFIAVLVILLIVFCLFIVVRVKKLIKQWSDSNFKNLQALDSLYRYQLNCIFTGEQPHNSSILNQFAMSNFYQELSQLVDPSYTSLTVRAIEPEKEEPVKFVPLMEKVKSKYSEQMKSQQEERNRELADLKYQIKSAVSEITDHVARKIKETYSKARELHLSNAFFYHAYLSLLQAPGRYEGRLRESTATLPEAILSLLRYMNLTVTSDRIMFPFKFAGVFPKAIEEELIMKLHFHLQQKYLASIKELDFGMSHCRALGLQKQIKYLQEGIDNKKYIFMIYLK